ncbi:Hypothetical predicted protein [Paramuricea clavata]|uniref:Uncharacterized protein n=1 Tax=Paramuricea clavata TaxID=317549 RepID=A0A6S7KR36_PARCT|nr:Hypothetical predicted protein [Paramuricea clavata]
METCCSLSNLGNIVCSESRGMSTNVNLLECTEDIHNLVSCHLSKSSLKEYEFILARAGLFHLENEQLKSMVVFPNHRNILGRFWRPFVPVNVPHMQGKNAVTKGEMLLIFSYPRKCTNCLEQLFRLDALKEAKNSLTSPV